MASLRTDNQGVGGEGHLRLLEGEGGENDGNSVILEKADLKTGNGNDLDWKNHFFSQT